MSAPTNVPPSSAVTVVQSIFEPVTGFKPIQITVPQYGPANLVGVLILTQNIRASFLIQVATTSPSGVEIVSQNKGWGSGIYLGPGQTFTVDNYCDELYAIADPSGSGPADLRVVETQPTITTYTNN
jgi:hypothetical protein